MSEKKEEKETVTVGSVSNVGLGVVTLHKFEPKHKVSFFGKDGRQVGEFDFSASPVTFIGDADASAQVFVDAVLRMWGH